jgi:hypothetical protein
MKTIQKLINTDNKSHSIFAWFGIGLGILCLMISLTLQLDVYQLNQNDNGSNSNEGFIIVNKQIGILNALNDASVKFTDNDLQDIKTNDWALDADGFVSNNYRITLSSRRFNFRTELFFESVGRTFIDTDLDDFEWTKKDNLVPVIMSNQFYNLYNFGFAAGQGLPKVPKDVLMGLEFDLSVSGGGKYRDMKIRVVGFSDRISSVLVPKSFMTWANSYFGEQSTNYSRLIIKVKDLASPDLSYELNKLNLELNKELLGGKVVNRVAIISSTIILCFGLMVFLLSALLIISTLKLKLVAIKENLRLLSQIGYSQSQILKAYLKPLFRNALVLTILNTFVYLLTKKQINNWYKQLGLNIDNFSLTPVVLMFVLVTLVVLLTRNTVVKILRQNPS